jgi:hypothetical protein
MRCGAGLLRAITGGGGGGCGAVFGAGLGAAFGGGGGLGAAFACGRCGRGGGDGAEGGVGGLKRGAICTDNGPRALPGLSASFEGRSSSGFTCHSNSACRRIDKPMVIQMRGTLTPVRMLAGVADNG